MKPTGPAPDPARLLSGYPEKAQLPPLPAAGMLGADPNQWGAITNADLTAWVGAWGTSYAANLTPDVGTGLGGWTADQFIRKAWPLRLKALAVICCLPCHGPTSPCSTITTLRRCSRT